MRAAAAGVGTIAVAIWVAWLWGPGGSASWDSATYIDGARYLAAFEGYVTSRGALVGSSAFDPITPWPPAFSACLAVPVWFGASPLSGAPVVLGIAYVVFVAALFGLGCRVAGAKAWPVVTLFTLCVALQPSTLVTVDAVLSDLPFAAATLCSVLLATALVRERRPRLQVACGVALGVTFLFRYAGQGVILGVVLGLLAARRGSLWTRLTQFVPLFAALAAVTVPLLVRNRLVSGSLMGDRSVHYNGFHENIVRAAAGSVQWLADAGLLPGRPSWTERLEVAVPVLCFCVLCVGMRIWRSNYVRLIALTFAGYVATMVVAATFSDFNPLTEVRFWVPTWALGAVLASRVVGRARTKWQLAFTGPIVILGLVCLCRFASAANAHFPSARLPREFSAPRWQALAARVPPARVCSLLSNDVRPMLVQRPLPPSKTLPGSLVDLEATLRAHPRLCIAFLKRPLPRSTEPARGSQMLLLATLHARSKCTENPRP